MNPEQSPKVLPRNSSHLFQFFVVQFGQAARRFNYSRRFVSLSTKRNRGKKGTIGLDHQSLKRKLTRNIAQVFGLFESEIAREGNIEPQLNRALGHAEAAAKTMHYTGAIIAGEFFTQNVDGVVISFA